MSQPAELRQICGVVLVRDDGAALLQLRDDIPGINDPGLWCFPGGHLEPAEPHENGARREFLEETAYRCGELHHLVTFPADAIGYAQNFELTFYWCRFDGKQSFVRGEGQDLRFVARADIDHLPHRDYLTRVWDLALRAKGAGLESCQEQEEMQSAFEVEKGFDLSASLQRCRRLRRRILDLSQGVSALHIAPAFSCMEILDAIYFSLMRRDNRGASSDTFLLSKGHGAMAQYVILEELGVLKKTDLDAYCQRHGHIGAHPDYGLPGIEASTGSLGHGLPMALGICLANRESRLESTTYVVMSDGELMEGSTWEAVLAAPNVGVRDLVVFVDFNGFVSATPISVRHPNILPVEAKFKAFGWETCGVDGHDEQAIYDAVRAKNPTMPLAVVAKTVKGKGVSYMENQGIWHYRSPNAAEYQQALRELEDIP